MHLFPQSFAMRLGQLTRDSSSFGTVLFGSRHHTALRIRKRELIFRALITLTRLRQDERPLTQYLRGTFTLA